MRRRKWGFPVWKISGGMPDPIEHLGDPDETPEPDTAPTGRAGMSPPVDAETVQRLRDGLEAWNPDGPPVQTAEPVTERLDVEPELRPWDAAVSPPRQPVPPPGVRLVDAPHCDGRHGDGHPAKLGTVARCEWCDALTSQISALKALERRITAVEERVAGLVAAAERDAEYDREMRERS